MKNRPILLILVLLASCIGVNKNDEKTIEAADAAYDQFDLSKSRKILNAILLTDSLPGEQKCSALRKLSLQDWKYYKDYDSALARLKKADSIGHLRFDTWMLINRIERESMHFGKSLHAALEAEKYAQTNFERNLAKINYAQTTYEFSVESLEKNELHDTVLLNKTSKVLSILLESNMGMPKPSKLLLGISLILNDGENLLKAWQSYFHIHDIHNAYSYMHKTASDLNVICENWKGQKLNSEQQEKLIMALADSRLYEFIPVYLKINQKEEIKDQNIKDIIAYSEYLKKVKLNTDEFYRTIAIGTENEKKYKNWLSEQKVELWNKLSFLSSRKYNPNDFIEATEEHFGARGFEGGTGSYSGYNLCLGHIVNQEKASTEQYGYKPDFTYTQIDMMTSNTYPSWFWEDKASGGWATESEIIRVREVYLDRPFAEWNSVTDSTTKREIELKNLDFVNDSTNQDMLLLAKKLETKLNFDASTDLYNKLYHEGLRNNELKLAFLFSFELYRMEATILAHEGRHSIEKKFLPKEFDSWNNEEREFHAKLSQIIFSTEPRYEIAGMLDDTGNSGHGMANRRIIDIAVKWIKNNKEQIPGFSENKSEFSQIHLLSTDQFKKCYREADPMNKEA